MLILLTIVSLLMALIMSVVAWRAVRAERERSAARVEALAQAIHQSTSVDELPLRPTAAPSRSGLPGTPFHAAPLVTANEEQSSPEMFGAVAAAPATGSRWGLVVAVGAFVIASVAAMVVVFGGDTPAARVAMASATDQAQAARRPVAAPLELVALSHDRDGNQLTVRGIVRNPANGMEMDRLTAVVVLFGQDGNVVSTTRTAVAASALIPGGESTFAVTIADAQDVARYRVSFRSDERVVAHVDRRTAS
jgi:hypothetical protein